MAEFTKDDTQAKIVNLIAEKLSIAPELIKPESHLQDLGADSLDLVEIIMKLEEQFGVEIDDEDAEKLISVEEVVDYVHERRTR